MASIFDSLKSLVTPELISSASSLLGEDSSNVTKAVSASIPSLLGSLLAKGNDPKVESALQTAGKAHDGILSNVMNLFSGKSDEQTNGIGSGLLNSILGGKLGGLVSLISSFSGISGKSSSGLLSMITPLIGGFLGKKMSTDGLNLSGLLGQLNSEKGSFLSAIPAGLTSVLGISSLSHLGSSLTSGAEHLIGDAKGTVKSATKKGMSMWKWLLPILLLAGLFFWWRSCNSNKVEDAAQNAIQNGTAAVSNAVDNIADKARSLVDLELSGGIKLKGYKDGIEEQVINFLESDKYKKADEETLKNTWFNFDNINFEFGSATQLTPESNQQIENVVAILKHYKNAKIKIGAYTDKKGDEASNLKLSQERANTVKSIFAQKGMGNQVVEAEGYGDKFATVSADASDEAREKDRKIALRFDK